MKLRIETPHGAREFVPRDGASYLVIGNRPGDDICIADDPGVSGPHARIECFLGKWSFTDQFSGTGTLHNGQQKYNGDLAAGDVLQVGSTRIVVQQLDGAAAKPQAAAPAADAFSVNAMQADPFAVPESSAFKTAEPVFDAEFETAPAPSVAEAASSAAAPVADAEELYQRMAAALRREGDDPEVDQEERDHLRKAARDALARHPERASQWLALLADKQVDAHDVVDHITGEQDADLSDLNTEERQVVDYVVDQFQRAHGVSLRGDTLAMQRIADAAEEAVPRLHRRGWDEINLPFITAGAQGPLHLNVRVIPSAIGLSRQQPEQATQGRPHFQVLPGGKKARAAGCGPLVIVGGIVALVLVLGVGIAMFTAMPDPEQPFDVAWDEDMPHPARQAPVARNAAQPGGNTGKVIVPVADGMSAERAKELEKILNGLADHTKEENAEQNLNTLETVEAECARFRQHGLRWPLERARTNVELSLMQKMQKRYGQDNGDIYELTQQSNYREAAARLAALDTYLNQTKTHTALAARMAMDEYLADQPGRITRGNAEYVGQRFAATAEALGRDDFAAAAAALGGLSALAILDQPVLEGVNTELAAIAAKAAQQKAGELPAARKPFDVRKDRLPASRISTLLPEGDATGLKTMRDLNKRLEKALKDGALVATPVAFFGQAAELAQPDDWRLKLKVTRPLPEGATTYEMRYGLHQLPSQTKLSLLETQAQGRNDLLALTMHAFEYGLLDDAARLACALWKADPEVKAELDELLATKLKIAVPEGGFVERDGRLVAP